MVADASRRLLDVIASVGGLVLLSPLFLLIVVLIKRDSPGPILYRARRIGKDGHELRLYKFRSMVAGADQHGPGITSAGDSRVTKLGRFLRRTKLDELPQLINVVTGDMSLVGPRPEDPRYVALYTPAQRRVLAVRPGITSAASLAYRHEERLLASENWERRYIQEIMPQKLAIELDYQTRRTLASDLNLIIRSVLTLVR